MAEFKIGRVYNFNTAAPAILGDAHKHMKVKNIMDADSAVQYRDVHMTNNRLIGTISGLPTNANDNTYVLFEDVDKNKILFAIEWIESDSIEEVVSVNIRIDIPNKSSADVMVVKNALKELGYYDTQVYTY